MIDFEGNYSAWMQKLAQNAAAAKELKDAKGKASSRGNAKPQASKIQASKPQQSKKADNPYLRPYGKLAMKDLERQITETEIALAECQGQFAGARSFKDPSRNKALQAEHDTLAKKLKDLEAEYFAREQ